MSPPPARISRCCLRRAVILLALVCSHAAHALKGFDTAEPPPPPAQTKAIAKPAQTAPVPAKTRGAPAPPLSSLPPVEPVGAARSLDIPAAVEAYRAAFQESRWKDATNAWERLREAEAGREDLRAALAKAMPSNTLVQVRFWRPCPECRNGVCATCEGKKNCATCAGSGRCALCKGEGGKSHACQSCRCPVCQGGKRCTSCAGALWRACRSCAGTGQGEQVTRSVACATCKGAGTLASGINGRSKTCPTCRGARSVRVTASGTCATCRGTGQQRCAACEGKGFCPACAGRGRTLACVACKATGRLFTACTDCLGKTLCAVCSGVGRCATCAGTATCPRCAGIGALEMLSLPAQKDWLRNTVGILRVPAPPPDAPVRLHKLPIRTGMLHVVSDPSPPPAELGKEWLKP